MSDQHATEQHQLLRDLRDATKAAREAAAELARQVAKAQEWDLGERCVDCGKRERVHGALCKRCATKILGWVTLDMLTKQHPGAQITLKECMRAVTDMLDGADEAMVDDEDGRHSYVIIAPKGAIRETWHGDDDDEVVPDLALCENPVNPESFM